LRQREGREGNSDSQEQNDSRAHQMSLSRKVVNDWISMMH
jgi:hypothetical protein